MGNKPRPAFDGKNAAIVRRSCALPEGKLKEAYS